MELGVEVAGRLRAQLAFAPGETVAVVGPNGAGKSTLLHVVAGLVRAEGTVRVDGEDWTDRPVQQRSIGMLFQDRLLFPHLSALDNVAFGLRSRGVARGAAREQAYAWLERVDLADLAARRPDALSGGQAQRVALARSMVTDPRVLLLDEPMGALDVGAAAGLRLELARRLREFTGVTLLVTHDAVDALTLADSVVVLDEGAVHQVGSPHEVATRPRTPHVARLVGLNVMRGVAEGTVVRLEGGGEVATATPARGPSIVAFAAASVALSPAEPVGSSVRNRWPGRVRGLTAQEARVRVVVDLEGLATTVVADVTTAAAADLGLAPGTPVWASVKATETTVYA
ncbi:ABC transporter ATP-binding protein [Nocardioidaceae bacterium]|nr:ABC transporter ATP-binding protein [Nocardioidaceae bacterium]